MISWSQTIWVCVAALCVSAAAHIPLIPEHLQEALYMGIAFVVFVYACLATSVILLLRPARWTGWLAAGLAAGAITVYAATRLSPFPQLADDVGNWLEPLGILAVASEAVVIAAGWRLARGLPTTPGNEPVPPVADVRRPGGEAVATGANIEVGGRAHP